MDIRKKSPSSAHGLPRDLRASLRFIRREGRFNYGRSPFMGGFPLFGEYSVPPPFLSLSFSLHLKFPPEEEEGTKASSSSSSPEALFQISLSSSLSLFLFCSVCALTGKPKIGEEIGAAFMGKSFHGGLAISSSSVG